MTHPTDSKSTSHEAVVIPMMEDCPYCENGMREYPPRYVDGDLYYDGEVLECDFCNGSSKIPLEQIQKNKP